MALKRRGALWKLLLNCSSLFIIIASSVVANDSSGSNQHQVDKPVVVSTITVMAGDRVELNCDVAVTTATASASAVFDHRRQPVIDQRRDGESLYRFDSRSYVGGHQHRHRRHPKQQKEQISSSSPSSSSHLSRRRRAAAAATRKGGGGGLTRVNYGGGTDPLIDADTDDEDDDNGYLVLWFVDPERKPFYSFDARRSGGGSGGNGRHWWDEERFGRRLRFVLPQPSSTGGSTAVAAAQSARLQIWNVTSLDAGDYRCRVDFNTAPSRNFKYRLYVAEPPTSVVILDSSLQQLSVVAGPLREGDDLILTCKAFGGHPQPWITWWQGGQLLDNTTDARSIEAVSNLLVVPRIQRWQLHDAFTCQVTSSPTLAPIMKTVTIELNLEPLFVEIVPPVKMNGGNSNSRTGTTVATTSSSSSNTLSVSVSDGAIELKCRTAGSRPSPTITWWKGNKQIVSTTPSPANSKSSSNTSSSLFTSISVTNSEDGNVTVSRLVMTPQPHDDGAHVTCRAKNALIPGAALEDSIKLDVQYVPEVRISLGRTINGAEIKEGDDLYIECHIRSNPPTHKLQWTHNGVVLMHNVSGGVVLSNVSLVLRAVTYARAGLYACSATNSRGETTVSKPPLCLRIQYAPRCRSVSASSASAVSVSGVSKQETASLDCQVDSDPETDVHFWWTFLGTPVTKQQQQQQHQFGNNSLLGGTVGGNADAMLLPRSLFSSPTPLSSVLNYSPQSELDFGVLACWASNSVGNQREPCLFHVVPAGRPAAPSNCAVANQTADSVRVDCQEAFDGGLQQTFGLELVDRETRTLRYVFNNTKPVFTVYGLEPETAFLLNIYALNAKGRSQPITLETTTLRAAQKLHTAGQQHHGGGGGGVIYFQLTPLLGVLVGAAATLLGIVLVVAIVVHRRNRLKREQHQRQQQQQQQMHQQPANTNSTQVHHQPLLTASANGDDDDDEDDHHRSAVVLSPSHNRQQQNGTLRKNGGEGVGGGKDQPDIILTDSSDFHMMKRTLPAVLQMTSSNCNSLSRSSTPGSVNSNGNGVSVGNENFALLTLHKQQQQQQHQIGSPFRSSPSELMMHQQQSTIGLLPHQYRPHLQYPMTGGSNGVSVAGGGGWLTTTSSSNNDNNALMMMTAAAMQQHKNQPESSF